MKKLLEISNLHAYADEKEILKGLNLSVNAGEVHVIMGPNGAGKSTLANVIFNNSAYKKIGGTVIFDGVDITDKKTDEIARLGIFLSFQSPVAVDGISVFNFLKASKSKIEGKNVNYFELKEEVEKNALKLQIREDLVQRDLNVGFSGGEKKKAEILQMLTLNPKLAILDETDSGLDVDAIDTVSNGINMFKNNSNAVIIITHSSKILKHLKIDKVHILLDGKIIKTGDASLIKTVEDHGYSVFKEKSNEEAWK